MKGEININCKKEYIKRKILEIFKKKENLKYIGIITSIAIIIAITIIYNIVVAGQKGLVINGVKMESKSENEIGVYIDGQVNKAGYVLIPNGETLAYAINKAEGITKDADIQNLDLDRKLKAGEKIVVPQKKTLEDEEDVELNETNSDKININTASKEQLTELDGIGEKTAEKIIEYREKQKFTDIEELKEVNGIGEKKFEKIKEQVEV